ncbi:MAG TPA: peptidase M1, partial [Terriglobales bacterium]|nr:peptidase M1 [Terriglobales bacterium]
MLLPMIRYLFLLLLIASGALAQVPEGIPRQLARERAASISDVHYKLSLSLQPHAPDVPGSIEITFSLKQANEVLLDYRDGVVQSVAINGQTREETTENGHIHVPASSLHAGQNTVSIRFTSHAGPAGKPIIQYEDKDDGSEYIYTLFVPMDASMAFPCFDQPDIKGKFQLNISVPPEWAVISNTAARRIDRGNGASVPATATAAVVHFDETLPLSTYHV